MNTTSSDDIEAVPQEECLHSVSPLKLKPGCKRAAILVSVALFAIAISAAVILFSKSKYNTQSTHAINAQDVNAVNTDAYPVAVFPTSDKRQIPDGFRVCDTEEACNQRRQELGFEKYIVRASASKGCFSKGNNAYFGTGGSLSAISKPNLPRGRERIYCEMTDDSFSTLSIQEKVVTYFAPFERYGIIGGPNIELNDGTFYELINLSPDFDDSNWITGVTTISIPIEAKFKADGTVDMKGTIPTFVADVDTRSESRFEGKKTLLAVRVVAANNKTTGIDEYSLSDSIFGIDADMVNLASQFKDCSYGQLKFITAQYRSGKSRNSGKVDIVNGVVTVQVPSTRVSQGTAVMRNAISEELNAIFDTTNPQELADYVIYCLPPGTFSTGTYSNVGYAYYNSWLSVFNNEWCTSLSLQMHEIGHSLNFGHSNEGGVTYEDGSGNMGASYKSSDRPKMCFNAAKSWQTGWYKDKEISIGGSRELKCFSGVLHGIPDYAKATNVLIRIYGKQRDVFINFNTKKGINQGTQEGGNQVLVVSRPPGNRDSFSVSNLEAKLSEGDSFQFDKYNVYVGTINIGAGTAEVTVLPLGQEICDET
eukprot:scaffold93091_cov70-Cyclotella_meneghiniana.AAC.2